MLRPKGVEIYLIYECPKCRCEWSRRPIEVKKLGGFLCDGCGHFTKFEPLDRATVKIKWKKVKELLKKVVEKEQKPSISTLTKIQEDAILALTSLGFPKKQSKEFVAEHNFQSVEDYIQGAVRKGTA